MKFTKPDIEPVTASFWSEDDGGTIGYMCLTDAECELGGVLVGNKVYPSVEGLLRCSPCAKSCGVAEVRVYVTKIVQEPSEEFYSDCSD